jgi:hypothetical protein
LGRVEAVVVISVVFPSTVKIGNIVNSLNEILWPLLWVGKKMSHGLTDFSYSHRPLLPIVSVNVSGDILVSRYIHTRDK